MAHQSQAASEIYVANTTFATHLDGAQFVVHKGVERVAGDHPFVVSNPQFFDLVAVTRGHGVETASAAPGERRGTPEPSTPPVPSTPPERTQAEKDALAAAVAKAKADKPADKPAEKPAVKK